MGEKTRSERERTRAGSRRRRHGAAAADLCAVEEEDERYCCAEESQPLRSSSKDEEERDALGSIARLMNAHVMPAQRLPIDLYIGTMNMVTPAPHRDLSRMKERESQLDSRRRGTRRTTHLAKVFAAIADALYSENVTAMYVLALE